MTRMVARTAAGWCDRLAVDNALRYIVVDEADIMEPTMLRYDELDFMEHADFLWDLALDL